jgi:hypothetical protein
MSTKKKKLADLVGSYKEAKDLRDSCQRHMDALKESILTHFDISNNGDVEKTETKEGISVTRAIGQPVGKAKDDLVLAEFAKSLPSDFVKVVPELVIPESLSIRWDLIQNRPEMVKLAAEKGIEIKQAISYRLKLDKAQ